MLWALLIAMTILAALLTLWPLMLRKTIRENSNSEIEFYQNQLRDIERDVERGQLPVAEAEAARAEMGRKLIGLQKEKATVAPFHDNPAHRWGALLFGLLMLPLLSILLYSLYGHPWLKDMPLAARDDVENAIDPISAAIAKIEKDIVAAPNNLKAWSTLAPVYMQLGRYNDAVIAYRNILRINGEDASIRALLGEAEIAAAKGIVTDEAKHNLEKALATDPTLAMAHYYLGLGIEQSGDTAKAIAIYEGLLDKVADRPNWVKVIKNKLATLKGEGQPASKVEPSGGQVNDEMIRGMVSRLAERLEKEGGNADDWLRLVRSYAVLGNPDKAEQALANARRLFKGDASATAQLQAIAKELGFVWQ